MTESHVAVDHRIMGGAPCVRGTRIPVTTIVALLGDGFSVNDILVDYPQLTETDIRAALHFAAAAVDERELPLRAVA
ncbi:MAG: DUF433 domain-containing protein [Mycobacteriales bacterium]